MTGRSSDREDGVTVTVTLDDIRAKFDALAGGPPAWEAVAGFAVDALQSYDADELVVEPSSEFDRVMQALLFLTAVDLKDSQDSYLHVVEDFAEYRAGAGF